ncbi:DUF3887 domain-containing protein [Clostridium neuense]|uniref:DUF3887 domain-containing protein n=1 Tax=Clostridium neuense TaxID=1728934 RepID=A0ABW8TEM5_9CLOT
MKKLFKFLAIALCIMMLGGCGAAKLSSNYSEAKLKAATEKVIDNLNNGKYDDIAGEMDEKVKAKMSAASISSSIKKAWTNLGSIGKYHSISKIVFQEKDGIAIVVAVAKYDNRNVQLTLSYNKNMKLEGIYIK